MQYVPNIRLVNNEGRNYFMFDKVLSYAFSEICLKKVSQNIHKNF